ncbi:MAG: ABC transporter permease [FCB group bacterium]|nr:ABC transporter permease [FCB group bacterium]
MLPLLSIKQFFRDMRNQKLRTLMTMFGIMWGTVSVILLMAFGTGLHEYQVQRFRGLGEFITIIWPGMTSQPWEGLPRGRRIRPTEDDVVGMQKTLSSIKSISPEFTRYNVMLKSPRENMVVRVSGVWPEFHEMRNIIPAQGGRFINDKDMANRRRTIFIGDELAEKLYAGEDPVGLSMQVNGMPFVIVGVMQPKKQNSSYGGRDKRNCYIPSTTFLNMYSHRFPNNIVVQAPDATQMERTKDDIYKYMAGRYNFNPEDTEALSIWDTTEGFKFFNTFFLAFRAFLVGIGCLTLITAGIGVTNIMNVVLEERSKEIGIKMALGAKRINILMQFMFETVLLTILGGTIGFLIALAIVKVFPLLNLTEHLGTPTLRAGGAIVTTSILGLLAFLAGIFPARRAASLEPVKALKLF